MTAVDGSALETPMIVGGFNPHSWATSGVFGDRNVFTMGDGLAFIFNLTTDEVRYLGTSTFGLGTGTETLNNIGLGPTFGLSPDLWIDSTLNAGSSDAYDYRIGGSTWPAEWTEIPPGHGIVGDATPFGFQVGQIEVFTFDWGPPVVPEPTTLALFGLGAATLALRRRQKRAST